MSEPRSLLVIHDTPLPAVDALCASALASALGGGAAGVAPARLRSPGRDFCACAAKEYVAPEGVLVANGFFWVERALSVPLPPWADALLGGPGGWPEGARPVFSLNPRHLDPEGAVGDAEAWLSSCMAGGFVRARVAQEGEAFRVLLEGDPGWPTSLGLVSRDAFSRPRTAFHREAVSRLRARLGLPDAPPSPPGAAPPAPSGPPVRIVVIGEEDHFRGEYPAVLASLGDAGDALGAHIVVTFLSAHAAALPEGGAVLSRAHGILVPGGCDMTQTEGQVAAATAGLSGRVPTAGLCLGMQTMAVAYARARAGMPEGNLEETRPEARPLVLTRLRGEGGEPLHRLGARRVRFAPGSALRAAFGAGEAVERMNHRYQLNPEVIPALAAAGLRVSATSDDGRVADGIECPGHPFFAGMQGHPEMGSRKGAPHPLLSAFLQAASRRAEGKVQGPSGRP